ncbi:MAG TPA: tRNA lysidine(34) synthetase TilS [Kofleriaceae bacterium]|nr:tRNA lysidine(34) synthetase TilS [Kofleriaceae bacterium]
MGTTPRDPVSTLRAAVKLWIDQLGAGLYGLACSGGADSMALADAACAVAGRENVVLVHIDHGLRDDSATVASELAAWAKGQGITAVVRRVDVRGESVEAAAREARYRAFGQLHEELGLSRILLAHTARDQAETVLMRMLRGTGPAGLAAMAAQRDVYVRPLLEISREIVDDYIAARGLPTWRDPMNEDPAFTRVRLRTVVLPALRAENPAIDDALVRLARAAGEWRDAIDALAEPFATFPIDCEELATQLPAIRKRAVALALERARLGYEAAHLDAIDALVMAPTAGEHSIDVPGARLVRSYETLEIRSDQISEIQSDLISGDYEVRVWRPGDRMKPARLKGRSRKLSDLYIDAKVPRAIRAASRVVIRRADAVIIYAEHLGISVDARPNDSEFLGSISFASQLKGPMLSNGRG